MADRRPIRLPRQWPNHVKSNIPHAISLASVVLSYARGRATGRRRLCAQLGIASRSLRRRIRRSRPIPIHDFAATSTCKTPQFGAAELGGTLQTVSRSPAIVLRIRNAISSNTIGRPGCLDLAPVNIAHGSIATLKSNCRAPRHDSIDDTRATCPFAPTVDSATTNT